MRSRWVLSSLVLAACGASATQKPAPAPPAASVPVTRAPAPAPPAPAPPPIPEAPPPSTADAQRLYVAKAMAYLPERTKVVLGIDVPRLARTRFGDKLRPSFIGPDVPSACQTLTAAQVGKLVIGALEGGSMLGASDGPLDERALRPCLEAAVRAIGGKLQSKLIRGRKAYHPIGRSDDRGWLAWPRAGGMLVATGEAALAEALDPKAAKLGGELAKLVARVDQSQMAWAAGIVPAIVANAMGLPAGTVSGPVAVRVTADSDVDTELDLVLELTTTDEATRVAGAVRQLITTLRAVPDTAPFLGDVRLGVYDRVVHVMAKLDAAATQKLVDAIQPK